VRTTRENPAAAFISARAGTSAPSALAIVGRAERECGSERQTFQRTRRSEVLQRSTWGTDALPDQASTSSSGVSRALSFVPVPWVSRHVIRVDEPEPPLAGIDSTIAEEKSPSE